MTLDLYNHVNRFKNRFEKFKKAKILVAGVGDNKKEIKLNLNNRDLVVKWIEKRKTELENINGYDKEVQPRYYKTLYKELSTYMPNILLWFNDTDFQDITKEDIASVYKGLEEGTLETIKGKKNLSYKTRKDFYGRVFKGGFFNFIGKDNLAKEVIKRRFTEASEVKFFDLDTLRVIADNAATGSQRLAYWVLFDTGIEVMALCQLKKNNFEWIQDKDEGYYILHVPKEISKKLRKQRDIYIHFNETNQLLKTQMEPLKDDERLFNFKPPALYHALKLVVDKFNLKTKPESKSITIKDFRSSMATYFLQQNWTSDEVKARLGHSPSSTEIDRYVNYLGINQRKQREKGKEISLKEVNERYQELEEKFRHLLELNRKQELEIEAFKVVTQTIFEGFNAEEIKKVVDEHRKKKGMPSFEEDARRGMEELKELKKKGKLDPVIEKEFDKLSKTD